MCFIKIQDLDLFKKKVFVRLDLNVPIKNNNITSDKRIVASLPTIKYCLSKGAKVILVSHLGRPIEGKYDEKYSLLIIIDKLNKYLNTSIRLVKDYLVNDKLFLNDNENLVMLENVRFNIGEVSNDDMLAKKYASLCDIVVMDAFATAHRMHASTYGIIKYSSVSCIGFLFFSEIKALSTVMLNPERPMVSIVGGSKVSSKFNILKFLSKVSDFIIVGGGIANTFISIDNNVGKSLHEPNYKYLAKKLRDKYNIPIPIDCRVGIEFSEKSQSYLKNLNNILDNEEIMDLGDKTAYFFASIILKAKTILWNGPLGVFEFPNFRKGTTIIAEAVVKSNAFSVVGGGDTIAILEKLNITNKISYISTGGGAFLEFIEGKKLPVISILEKKFKLIN